MEISSLVHVLYMHIDPKKSVHVYFRSTGGAAVANTSS